ncbi:MAG: DUF1150 family protein [Rhodobacteraceae bacterium]|nr:DUF1150 family protein [Paracoccaceae bacterium]
MNEPFEFGAEADDRIAYVRAVQVADLPPEVRERAGDLDVIWAVHDEDGEQLALVADRKLAFYLARQNHLAPVSVH